MKQLKLFLTRKEKNKGQSLMEMTVVLLVLLILVLGMVEFGNLLNQYISLVDGVRAGARFGSNNDPFADPNNNNAPDYTKVQETFYTNIDEIVDGKSQSDRPGAIGPLILSNGYDTPADQVMISFLSLRGGTGAKKTYITYGPWKKYPGSPFTTSKVLNTSVIDSSLQDGSPNTGVLIVEVFYHYYQLLKLPFLSAFVPDPIPVHAYAIMPLSAAEPTPDVQ